MTERTLKRKLRELGLKRNKAASDADVQLAIVREITMHSNYKGELCEKKTLVMLCAMPLSYFFFLQYKETGLLYDVSFFHFYQFSHNYEP